MDYTAIKGKISQFLGKYRYVLLILLIGFALMLIPDSTKETETVQETTQQVQTQTDLAQQLEQILTQIEGAGDVKVLLTVAKGEQTVYQYDESASGGESGSVNRETVIITDSSRGQSGLVSQIVSPKYQGAIVLCEGADRSAVKLGIMEAVAAVTGLGMDKISVLKMK